MQGYFCRACGKQHDELPMHYLADAPNTWYAIPASERDARCEISSDSCVIDGKHFFILGNLEIPVVGSNEAFSWDVWVSLSEQNFIRAGQLWTTPGRESESPYFGWLSTQLPIYGDTINLKTMMHTREIGRRPYIELEPTNHPLALEQRNGISLERVQEIAEMVLHAK